MTKKTNRYKIKLEDISELKGQQEANASLEFDFENHDNILEFINKLQEKDIFENKNQAAEFALGIKLFTEVLMKTKNNPLFTDLIPAMSSFMRKLKAQ